MTQVEAQSHYQQTQILKVALIMNKGPFLDHFSGLFPSLYSTVFIVKGGEREEMTHRKMLHAGIEPTAAVARTLLPYMGCPLYSLSYWVPHNAPLKAKILLYGMIISQHNSVFLLTHLKPNYVPNTHKKY